MQFMFMALRQIYIYIYLSHEIKFSLVIYVFSFKPIIAGIINWSSQICISKFRPFVQIFLIAYRDL